MGEGDPARMARALLSEAELPNEPAIGVVQRLLRAIGYDFRGAANSLRANDSLIRARSAGMLADAARGLAALSAKFREEFIPPATREQPFPPAEIMKALQGLDALRRRVGEASSAMLTQQTPGSDSVWARLRSERALLERLLTADIELVSAAHVVCGAVERLSLAEVRQRHLAAVEAPLAAVDAALKSRGVLLD